MNVLCLVWGILALLGFMVGFIPCLGALNWVNIPFAAAGAILCVIALPQSKPDEKGMPIAGLVMCLVAIFVGAFRLLMGGGLL